MIPRVRGITVVSNDQGERPCKVIVIKITVLLIARSKTRCGQCCLSRGSAGRAGSCGRAAVSATASRSAALRQNRVAASANKRRATRVFYYRRDRFWTRRFCPCGQRPYGQKELKLLLSVLPEVTRLSTSYPYEPTVAASRRRLLAVPRRPGSLRRILAVYGEVTTCLYSRPAADGRVACL